MIAPHVEVLAPADADILSASALEFIVRLHRELDPIRLELLERRHERQRALDAGERPDFLSGTQTVRTAEWRVAEAPSDLCDRREISRAQVWSWLRAGRFDERQVRDEISLVPAADEAKELFSEVALASDFVEFLTLPGYQRLE